MLYFSLMPWSDDAARRLHDLNGVWGKIVGRSAIAAKSQIISI
jgi:hypothetical protein